MTSKNHKAVVTLCDLIGNKSSVQVQQKSNISKALRTGSNSSDLL